MTETALGAAFRRAGIDANEAKFRVDLARYLNNGGTTERAIEIVRSVAETLPDEGQRTFADDGHYNGADVRQTNGAGGHPDGAEVGQMETASRSTDEAEAGQRAAANHEQARAVMPASVSPNDVGRARQPVPNGQASVARSTSPPPREPSPADVRAAGEAWRSSARAIMKIDGYDIRDWTIGQALTAARRKGTEHYVLSVLGGLYKHEPHTKTFREVSTDREIEAVVRQAGAFANA